MDRRREYTSPTNMKKHLPLVLLRCILANGLWQVLPFAHLTWSPQRYDSGPTALRFLLLLHLIGLGASILYFFAASGAHLLLRRRRGVAIALADGLIGGSLALTLLYWGVTATYPEPPAAPPVLAHMTPGGEHARIPSCSSNLRSVLSV